MGKTTISFVLERLPDAGITEAIVVSSPADHAAISRVSIPGIHISTVIQETPNGMSGAVLAAKKTIAGRPIFIVNATDLVDRNLFQTLGKEMANQAPFIVGRKVTEYIDIGYIKFQSKKLQSIVEKPGKGNEPSDYTDLVFDYFPDPYPLFRAIERTTSMRDDLFERALSDLSASMDIDVVRYDGYWVSLKYPWHIFDFMNTLFTDLTLHQGKNVKIHDHVVIKGDVIIGDNVTIFENVKIVGPCYIGDHTIIGNNTMIRQSHIGSNCVTGFNSDITRSYIGDNCWLHSNYVGDSILEGNVSMGSGTVLANLRLDGGEIFSVVGGQPINTMRTKHGAIIGKHVRIGVNTSVMPGVKIGGNSFIGAGIVIDRDIPEQRFARGKTLITTTQNTHTIDTRDAYHKNP